LQEEVEQKLCLYLTPTQNCPVNQTNVVAQAIVPPRPIQATIVRFR